MSYKDSSDPSEDSIPKVGSYLPLTDFKSYKINVKKVEVKQTSAVKKENLPSLSNIKDMRHKQSSMKKHRGATYIAYLEKIMPALPKEYLIALITQEKTEGQIHRQRRAKEGNVDKQKPLVFYQKCVIALFLVENCENLLILTLQILSKALQVFLARKKGFLQKHIKLNKWLDQLLPENVQKYKAKRSKSQLKERENEETKKRPQAICKEEKLLLKKKQMELKSLQSLEDEFDQLKIARDNIQRNFFNLSQFDYRLSNFRETLQIFQEKQKQLLASGRKVEMRLQDLQKSETQKVEFISENQSGQQPQQHQKMERLEKPTSSATQ